MKLIVWFARNPIAANFLMLLIIAGGILGLTIAKRYTIPRRRKINCKSRSNIRAPVRRKWNAHCAFR